MKKRYAISVAAVLVTAVISGCAVIAPRITEDTIIKIYADEKAKPKEFPVIFVPGMFGSVLEDSDSHKVIWGNVSQGLIRELALPIDSTKMSENKDSVMPVKMVTAFTWLHGAIKKDVYLGARRMAVNAAGYTVNKDVFSLSYDWRRDLVEAAQHLGALIDEIKRKAGDDKLKVNIVCHSAGGLVVRYYAKYGVEDVLDRDPIPQPTYAGAKNINKIIMLGTPNLGSLEAFQHIHEGLALPTIGRMTRDITFSMPSAYELMPFGNDPVFIDAKGNVLEIDIQDPQNWEKYGWSVFADANASEELRSKERRFLAAVLKRAKAFHQALWSGDLREERKRITYILLGSDANPTLSKALLRSKKYGWKIQFNPHDDTLNDKVFEPGDGSVTRRSLLGIRRTNGMTEEFPSVYEIFFAQYHINLAGDPTFLDNVLHSLLDKINEGGA